ncbi:unnamed protein product [Parnassius mnemosyne]|uniref:Uncharacterized protein n=1 Tax=Parnassius mnemosyne TaxID=213953 RepID=A0AAV1MB30_9NEOP
MSILSAVLCSPYDDGKYRPRTYYEYDDGKYYRPLDEGKYIPGDEGKYTYVYKQGTWPYDGSYMRQYGFNGEYDPYMGYRIYASRFPYLNGVIKGLVSKYVSSDSLNFGEAAESSKNYYSKIYSDKKVAMKCKYITPKSNEKEFTTQHPPVFNLDKGENLGSLYTFKGSKVLNTVSNAPSNKLKLQYEVIVRVVDDGSENNEKTAKKDEVKAPIIILKPSSDIKVDSSKNSEVKKTFSKIVKSLIIDDVLPTVSGVLPLTPDDVKLTIDDVQLLQTEKVSPTTTLLNNVEDISTTTYTPSLNNDEFMPIISSQSNLGDYMTDYDDITTEDLLQPLTENVANVSVGDIQTSTEAGQS